MKRSSVILINPTNELNLSESMDEKGTAKEVSLLSNTKAYVVQIFQNKKDSRVWRNPANSSGSNQIPMSSTCSSFVFEENSTVYAISVKM